MVGMLIETAVGSSSLHLTSMLVDVAAAFAFVAAIELVIAVGL